MSVHHHLRGRSIMHVFRSLALKHACAMKLSAAHTSWLRLTAGGIVFMLGLGAGVSPAADRYVVPPGTPGGTAIGEYTDWTIAATQIQWAVKKATTSGDTVWVTNGTYYLTNTITVGDIKLRSVNGREATIINGNYPAYSNGCLIINSPGSVTGFTIMNGYNTNSSTAGGGGVTMYGGTLRNCHITTNTCAYSGASQGGGIRGNSSIYIYDCIIASNYCDGQGGGIYGGTALISNCVFRANSCGDRGGGMAAVGGLVINCTFISNNATISTYSGGGAIYNIGAGIYRNCLLVGNKSTKYTGAGFWFIENGNGLIQNSTIVGNIGIKGIEISGAAMGGKPGGRMENCIVASNILATSAALAPDVIDNAVTNLFNNRTDTSINAAVNKYTNSTGNITTAPAFLNYAAGDYRLANNSPCINTGTNQSWMTGAFDLDNQTRIRYGTVDMGAYEHISQGTIFKGR